MEQLSVCEAAHSCAWRPTSDKLRRNSGAPYLDSEMGAFALRANRSRPSQPIFPLSPERKGPTSRAIKQPAKGRTALPKAGVQREARND